MSNFYVIYLVEIGSSNYSQLFYTLEMLNLFIKGLAKNSNGFNAGHVSLAIHQITTYLLQRIDARPIKFLVHFKDFFINTRDSNSQVLFVSP